MNLNSVWAFVGSAMGSGLIALFFLLVWQKMLFPDVKENSRRWAKGFTFVFALICVAALLGVPLISSSTAPPAQTAGSYSVTASDAQAWTSEDNAAHTITVATAFDYTNNTFTGGTGTVIVQFAILRGIGTVGLVQTSVDVSNIPTVTGSNGLSHPMIVETLGLYSATWNQSGVGSANMMMTVNLAETQSGAIVTLTAVLDPAAMHVQLKYATQHIGLTIAGQSWDMVVLLATTSGLAGYTGS